MTDPAPRNDNAHDHANQNRAAETQRRRQSYRTGKWSERAAAAALMLKGYRILARGFRTRTGKIDLIGVRGRRIAFIEVKRRLTMDAAEAAISERQRQRVRRAAEIWMSRNRRYENHQQGFDVVFVLPRRWPRHLPDAL